MPGLGLADARARHPDLAAFEAEPAADAALLDGIADWADRWTPLVAEEKPDPELPVGLPVGLMLDITGCAHLFGGEVAMRRDILDRLARQDLRVTAAVADTPGAAWALARFGRQRLAAPGEARAALLPLPLAALRLPMTTVAAMGRVGLERIADIADLPRPPLAARFGTMLLTRLDQAMGWIPEAISPRRTPPPYLAERRPAEPIVDEAQILGCVEGLGAELAQMLEERGEGARRVELALFRVDGAVRRLAFGTSRPMRDPAAMRRLFAERLAGLADPLDAGFGFDVIRLSVSLAEPLAPRQADLAADPVTTDDARAALDRLADGIAARFGGGRVRRIASCDSHIPERAAPIVPWEAPVAAAGTLAEQDTAGQMRPLRLFDPPEPVEAIMATVPDGPPLRFRWRRVSYEVARFEGPERIAGEWWKVPTDTPPPPTRDYFRVEDRQGHRFWLFRAGLWERETEAHGHPRWYLHGQFA